MFGSLDVVVDGFFQAIQGAVQTGFGSLENILGGGQ